jgi:Tol biopolymer transport system component
MHPGGADQLSHTVAATASWVEEAGSQEKIVRIEPDGTTSRELENAEYPVASPGGESLAYLRSRYGKAELWVRALNKPQPKDTLITSANLDVTEMTFLADGESLIFAAAGKGGHYNLFTVSKAEGIHSLGIADGRYPAASPDGHWLAYSQLRHGVWNLWLRDLQTGVSRRLTRADCNDISPAWDQNSTTILYSSDCGRALWSTALYRKRVVP